MNNVGDRGTDEIFHQLMTTTCGTALLKLVGLDSKKIGNYSFRAVVVKAVELRPDLEAIPNNPNEQRVFIEFQDYPDVWIRYRQSASILLSCRANNYRGPVLGVIIFTSESYQQAALPLTVGDPYGEFCLTGRIKEMVLTNYTEAELLAIDRRLVVLAPWTINRNESPQQLITHCQRWRETVETAYEPNQRLSAIDLLTLFLLNRFRNLSYEEIITMLHFDLCETFAGQQLLEMGAKKGKLEGIKEGKREGKKEGKREGKREGILEEARQMVSIVLTTRFNSIPEDILMAVSAINSPDILKNLMVDILHCDSVATVRALLRIPE